MNQPIEVTPLMFITIMVAFWLWGMYCGVEIERVHNRADYVYLINAKERATKEQEKE